MPPVIVAIAAAVADAVVADALTGVVIFGITLSSTAALVIGSLVAFGIYALASALGLNGPSQNSQLGGSPAASRTLSLRQPIASHKLIYGQLKVGGTITFIDTTSDNKELFAVITLSGHPLSSIDGVYLNGAYVPLDGSGNAQTPVKLPDGTQPTDYSGYCTILKGLGTIPGDAALIAAVAAASPKWGANPFQYSRGKLYVKLTWNANLFGATGIPNMTCVVRGRMAYDPRDTGVDITSSASGTPGVFLAASAHGFSAGDMVFIKQHVGAIPVTQPVWPAAQIGQVAQEYEVGSIPDSTHFTLLGTDSQPLALTTGGTGGTVTKMHWTDNSEILINDYLVEPIHGMGVVYDSEIDETLVVANANLCDEIVPRSLPVTTFSVNTGTQIFTYAPEKAAGVLPPLCQVIVFNSGGALPTGLAALTVYYYVQQGAGPDGYLCDTQAHAAENPPTGIIHYSTTGSGTNSVRIVESITPDHTTSTMGVYSNTLRITTGTEVTLNNIGGGVPSGLVDNTNYFAIFLSDTIVQLAATLDDARNGIAIAFTDNGSGTNFLTAAAEPRYTCNGMIDTAQPRQSIIQDMLTSMGGYLVPSGNLLNIYPAQYLTPTVTLSESDLRDSIQIKALQSGLDSFNSVKGTFLDPFNQGQPTDYPFYQDATYVAEDQFEVVWNEMTLNFTNSSSMAQRLAKISLERVRRELTVTMPLKLTAFQVGAPDVIYVNNVMMGWVLETFEVASWQFSVQPGTDGPATLNCDITGRQTDLAVFAWTAAEELAAKRQTNTNLPNPFVVKPPTNLALASGGALMTQQPDGTLVSRIHVTWTAPNDHFVVVGGFIDITYKKHADSIWQFAPTVDGDQTDGYIENAEVGVAYDVAIRSRNMLNAVSDDAYPWQAEIDSYTVGGKTAAPSDIASLTVTTNGTVVMLEAAPISDTDLVAYEYRYGASMSWTSGTTVIEQVAAVQNGVGGLAGTCTSGKIPAGTWWFSVKAINRSGTYSTNAAFAQATVPNAIDTALIAANAVSNVAGAEAGGDASFSFPCSGNSVLLWAVVSTGTEGGIYILRDGFPIGSSVAGAFESPVMCIDNPGAGTYTYGTASDNGTSHAVLSAVELKR